MSGFKNEVDAKKPWPKKIKIKISEQKLLYEFQIQAS